MNGFIGEFFGTLILIVLGVGCCAGIHLKKTYSKNESWLYLSIAWGLAVTFGVYVAGMLGSDGHLNPAITIGFAMFGFFPWSHVFSYILGQFLGGFIGAFLVILQYYPHFAITKNEKEGNYVGIFSTVPAIKSRTFNFISEFLATFVFVFVLFNLGNFTKGLKPLIVGLLITVIGLSLGGTTGFAINPARDFSPRVAYYIFPIPNKGSANWKYAWIPFFGPLLGGLFAGALQFILM